MCDSYQAHNMTLMPDNHESSRFQLTLSLAKIYTMLVADVSRDQRWNGTDRGKLQQVEIHMSPLPLCSTEN